MLAQAILLINSSEINTETKSPFISKLRSISKNADEFNEHLASSSISIDDFDVPKAKTLFSSAEQQQLIIFQKQEMFKKLNKLTDEQKKYITNKLETEQQRGRTMEIPELGDSFILNYYNHFEENFDKFASRVLFTLQNLSFKQLLSVTWSLYQCNYDWLNSNSGNENPQYYTTEYIATRALLRNSSPAETQQVFETLSKLKASGQKYNSSIKTISAYRNLKDKFQITILSYLILIFAELKCKVDKQGRLLVDDSEGISVGALFATVAFRAIVKFIIEKSFTSYWLSLDQQSRNTITATGNFGLGAKVNILLRAKFNSPWVTYLKINKKEDMAFLVLHCNYLKSTPVYQSFLTWIQSHEVKEVDIQELEHYNKIAKIMSKRGNTNKAPLVKLTFNDYKDYYSIGSDDVEFTEDEKNEDEKTTEVGKKGKPSKKKN